MKKKSVMLLVACTLAGSILFSSCVGQFALTNRLLKWNRSIDSKFVNELVFIAFCIVPVYEVTVMADALVINSIEFWSGDNPLAAVGTVKNVQGTDGMYQVKTLANGYEINKKGDTKKVDLVYNKSDKTWSVEADGQSSKLMQMKNDDEVVMYLPGGQKMNVELNAAGVTAFRHVALADTYYAQR
jgi:hypothetical protein